MSIAPCPSCHDDVRLPVQAHEDARVRCPLCGEEYSLKSVLEQLPPELELVESIPEFTAAGRRASGASVASGPSQSFDSVVIKNEDAQVDAHTARLATTRSRQKNPLAEFLKIGLGAVLAVPVAQLILWWLPGQWQRDPLEIGPRVGALAPFLVPANFRPEPAAVVDTSVPLEEQAGDSTGQRPLGKQSSFLETDSEPGADAEPVAEETSPDNPEPKSYPIPEVAGFLQDARSSFISMTVSGQGSAELQQAFLSTMYRFADGITYMKPAEKVEQLGEVPLAQKRQQELFLGLQGFLSDLKASPESLVLLGKGGRERLQTADVEPSGVVVFGTVQEQRELPGYTETDIKLAVPGESIVTTLYTLGNPISNIAARERKGKRLIVFGVLLKTPRDQLPTYEGTAEQLILGGYVSPL